MLIAPTRGERRRLCALFEAVLPPETAGVPLERFLDALVSRAPARVVLGLRGALLFVRLAAVLRGRRLSRRTPAERVALLEDLRASDVYLVREVPTLFKALAGFAGFGHPAGQRAFGLPTDATPPEWAR